MRLEALQVGGSISSSLKGRTITWSDCEDWVHDNSVKPSFCQWEL
jgi:hypothetical protein